ncbi:hypothetical protein D915_003629 [Fasciola hepatica]|uniref:Uncharacterized protein n=1 Tax=Fasciola hepatica TaxID=6192 RepID=A0A2H1CIB1_FASHE|nr:hypothetical protein D915_003629 [Fasciola hepatica]
MNSTYGTMSHFTRSGEFSKSTGLIAIIICIIYTLTNVQGLPVPKKVEMNYTSTLLLRINNDDNIDNADQASGSSVHNMQDKLNNPFLRNGQILNKNSFLTQTREYDSTQKRPRFRRTTSPGVNLWTTSFSRTKEKTIRELFHPDGDFASMYTIETLPEDITFIQPDQWIYFRICTQPNEPINYHPDGLEAHIREKIKFFSCVNTNVERPAFKRDQLLVLTIQNVPTIQFDVQSRRLHAFQYMINEQHVKFWLHHAEHTILVGIRPQLMHDRFDFEFRLETHKTGKSNLINPLSSEIGSHNKAVFQGDSKSWEKSAVNNEGSTHSIHAIYLKRFTIHYVKNFMKLILKSNRTGPYLIYDPNPIDEPETSEAPSKKTSNWTEPIFENQVQTAEDSQKTSKPNRLDLRKAPTPFISTDVLLDTRNPDPMTINEAMDEQAIRLAQSTLASDQELLEEYSVGMMSRTSPSLLIPTEPNGRTVVQLAQLDEVIQFACQGHIPDGQLRLLFDRDAWHEESLPELTFHSVDGSEQVLKINLRATRITWPNVTRDMLESGLRDLGALTNVKCGSYQSSRLVEQRPVAFSGQTESAVDELYFVTVSSENFQLIQKFVDGKLSDLYEPIHTVALEVHDDEILIPPVHHFIHEKIRPASTGLARAKPVGFWNLSLASLSSAKLVLSFVVVTLIVLSIILLIRNYGKMRPILSNTPAVSQWMGSGRGDTPTERRQKHVQPPGRRNRLQRRDQSPRPSASMTNSNAVENLNDSYLFDVAHGNQLFGSESNELVPRWHRNRQRKSN